MKREARAEPDSPIASDAEPPPGIVRETVEVRAEDSVAIVRPPTVDTVVVEAEAGEGVVAGTPGNSSKVGIIDIARD